MKKGDLVVARDKGHASGEFDLSYIRSMQKGERGVILDINDTYAKVLTEEGTIIARDMSFLELCSSAVPDYSPEIY